MPSVFVNESLLLSKPTAELQLSGDLGWLPWPLLPKLRWKDSCRQEEIPQMEN